MRMSIRIAAITALTLSLSLAVAALAQTSHQQHAAAKPAPAVDPDKAYMLHQEYVAKTAELHGKVMAKQAELETLLATKPGDEAAIKKLAAEISALRGQLFEQTTLFRVRFAKETGMPMHMTRGFGGKGGMMMDGQGMDCMMMGKGMGMGMGMMGKGMMMGMDQGGMNMPMPAQPGDAPKADAPAKAQ